MIFAWFKIIIVCIKKINVNLFWYIDSRQVPFKLF